MAIFVLLRFPYPETGPFLRPAAARRAGRPTCGTTCVESSGGAPELLPVLRGEDEHACGLRASSGSETPVIGAMPAALRPGAGV